MTMSITKLERALRGLRLSGMGATLRARALPVASHEMDFIEAFSWWGSVTRPQVEEFEVAAGGWERDGRAPGSRGISLRCPREARRRTS